MPTEDLFVYCYTLTNDLILDGQVIVPPRPGPGPGCTDAQVLTIVLVRHLLHRTSESGFLAEIRRDYSGWFPRLPHHSEFNRRVRRRWGAFEQIRALLADVVPADHWGQVDTTALPVTHPCRVRGPDSWNGPNGLTAQFGRDTAHAEWFYGFRLAIRTDRDSRPVRAWAIVPAAINERDLVPGLVEGADQLIRLPADKGLNGSKLAEPPCRARDFDPRPPRPGHSARPCRPGCGRSSPSDATGSRPPSGRSPTRWPWPATPPTPSGAY